MDSLLLNLLASALWDLLKALGKPFARREDALAALQTELQQTRDALQALQSALLQWGGVRLLQVQGSISGSIVILGDGNTVTLDDGGRLAQHWVTATGDSEAARRLYLEFLAGHYAGHLFPLSKLSFNAPLGEIYQPPTVIAYRGEWQPSLRTAPRPRPLENLLTTPSPVALTGLLGGGCPAR
ncbi:MAG: hypothetical protein ABWK53_05820 [Anaerolineales bacterium]